ncbi:MAG: membrane protein insertase YidC [Deltaproteobacteria bacterium]|nr:MAG: membrane protein insertase YidC [Deltaproteobacteria bacterium]
MDRNFVIGMILMTVLFYLWIQWGNFFPSEAQKRAVPQSSSTPSPPPASPQGEGEGLGQPTPLGTSGEAVPKIDRATEEIVPYENEHYLVELSSLGGSLKAWRLKHYYDSLGKDRKRVVLFDEKEPGNYLGQFRLGGSGFLETSLVPYEPLPIQGEKIAFRWKTPGGVQVTKTYTFNEDYSATLAISIENRSEEAVSGIPEIFLSRDFGTEAHQRSRFIPGPLVFAEKKLHKPRLKELRKEPVTFFPASHVQWFGFDKKYFLTAVVPLEQENVTTTLRNLYGDRVQIQTTSAARTVAPGETLTLSYMIYGGPKKLDLLEQKDFGLSHAISFGWVEGISIFFLKILNFFYRIFGNYGVAIILLTILVRMALYPLAAKSFRSMKKMSEDMKKIQPQLERVKEKYYETDRQRYQREVMEVYKRNNVNPVGCIGSLAPTLLQIPVFIGLYYALYNAIELRHAPFVLWIQDLSAKDPLLITPILMGISMYLSQKLTPTTTTDPMQKKMMTIMPIIFTFMFLGLPSGLILYWLVSNIVSIAQTYWMNKQYAREEAMAASPGKHGR